MSTEILVVIYEQSRTVGACMIENYIIVVEVCLLLYIKFKITDKRNFHKSKQNIFG